jgi:putative spermidine/putrescine transport system substrate-binding protein
MSRARHVIHSRVQRLIALGVIGSLAVTACGGDDGDEASAEPAPAETTAAAADAAASNEAAVPTPGDPMLVEQASNFRTLGMPDDWNNFGEFYTRMCDEYELGCVGTGVGPNRFDTDMSSAEEIAAFASETADPAVCADIGIAFGQVAEAEGVVIDYLPAAAADFPAAYRPASGAGWVPSAVGVISFVVNTDRVPNPPQTWNDLLNEEYRGLVSISNPTTSGTGQMMVLSSAAALGGGTADLDAAMEFWREMVSTGQINEAEYSNASLERGETPITIRYDYVGLNAARPINEKAGSELISVTVPDDGGIWSPSATMCNVNTDSPELARTIMDFTLSDAGQLAFAEYGARPIRFVTGDLEVPADIQANWLPESEYENVVDYPGDTFPDPAEIAERWESEVLG